MPDAAAVAAATRVLPRKIRLTAALLLLLCTAGLLLGGSHPVAVGLFKPGWDKLAHVVVFAGLGAACGVASGRQGWRMLLWSVLGALAVGSMDELHQLSLQGREPGWDDLLADGAGGLLGGVGVQVVYGHYAERKRRRACSAPIPQTGAECAASARVVA